MGTTVQTSYDQYMDKRYAGQIDTASIGDNISMIIKGSNVGFGLAVVQDTADGNCKVATATGGTFRGVTVRNLNVNNSDAGVGEYLENAPISLRRFGEIVVLTEVAVTKDDAVFFRHTANGTLDTLGAFRDDADTAKADAITGATFAESVGAGELVRIKLPTIY